MSAKGRPNKKGSGRGGISRRATEVAARSRCARAPGHTGRRTLQINYPPARLLAPQKWRVTPAPEGARRVARFARDVRD